MAKHFQLAPLTMILSIVALADSFTTPMAGSQQPNSEQRETCNCPLHQPLYIPPGPQGVQGPPGAHGPQGLTGPAGDPGNHGIPGQLGGQGLKGEQGQGSPGSRGEGGQKGDTGYPGPRGLPGKRGPQGIVGIPGFNGSIGFPGRDGVRGLTGPNGEKGQLGVKGHSGHMGDKGESGVQGHPGHKGHNGESGVNGHPGNKGEPGTSYTSPAMSAFSAQLKRDLTGSQTITFDAETLDLGNDFDHTTGIFTCRIPGLYSFTFTISKYGRDRMDVELKINGSVKALIKTLTNNAGGVVEHEMQTQNVLLLLQQGDVATLYAIDDLKNISNANTNIFNGYLVHAS